MIISLSIISNCLAQTGGIKGRIAFKDTAAAFASVKITGTEKGTLTDEKGNFELKGISPGNQILIISAIGYQTLKIPVTVASGHVQQVKASLTPVFTSLNDVVITGTRTSRRRLESPVAVNILDSRTFNITQSHTVSEGLCFQPGLRMETDCQTCNYTQLRMNGLGGSYSQVLINSRPLFTSLMSLYGLEQIPANMVERIEVVRGGGSVMYGSSAIAGTVNIITKEPEESSFLISSDLASVKGKSADRLYNLNGSIVNEEKSAGTSIFASHRDRAAFDANGDGFSEMPKLINNSFGFNTFLKLNAQNRLEVNGWSIYEERRGGNKIDEQADKADQSEYRLHNIILGGLNYEHWSKDKTNSFGFYISGQNTKRTHYTGIDHSDAWGHTKSHSFQGGVQYNHVFNDFLSGRNTLTSGLEVQNEYTFDQIELYDYLIDQTVNLTGVFIQSDWDISRKFSLLSGFRVNKSNKVDKLIITPRISSLYKINPELQARVSYARGFKAPQAFETDMHIAFAGGGVSLIRLDPNLREETSNSYNVSLDFNKANETLIYGFTLDGFYTRLNNAFSLEETGTDGNGNQQLLRKNGGRSVVKGVTAEGRINYSQKFQIESGLTLQRSFYNQPVAWSSELAGSKEYLRTPGLYGFFTLSILPQSRFNANISGVITGPMKVPHFSGAPGVDNDVLLTSQSFTDITLKLACRFTLKNIRQDLQIYTGIQNMFNQYQNDFDTGKNRDSNYIYGPQKPVTCFAGLKFGLM